MKPMYTYKFRLSHDNGTLSTTVIADSQASASKRLQNFEGCPPSAITLIGSTKL